MWRNAHGNSCLPPVLCVASAAVLCHRLTFAVGGRAAKAQETAAASLAAATKIKANAEAEATQEVGVAQAAAKAATGKAETDFLANKAEAYKHFGEAYLIQTIVEQLPAVAERIAAPLAQTEKSETDFDHPSPCAHMSCAHLLLCIFCHGAPTSYNFFADDLESSRHFIVAVVFISSDGKAGTKANVYKHHASMIVELETMAYQ